MVHQRTFSTFFLSEVCQSGPSGSKQAATGYHLKWLHISWIIGPSGTTCASSSASSSTSRCCSVGTPNTPSQTFPITLRPCRAKFTSELICSDFLLCFLQTLQMVPQGNPFCFQFAPQDKPLVLLLQRTQRSSGLHSQHLRLHARHLLLPVEASQAARLFQTEEVLQVTGPCTSSNGDGERAFSPSLLWTRGQAKTPSLCFWHKGSTWQRERTMSRQMRRILTRTMTKMKKILRSLPLSSTRSSVWTHSTIWYNTCKPFESKNVQNVPEEKLLNRSRNIIPFAVSAQRNFSVRFLLFRLWRRHHSRGRCTWITSLPFTCWTLLPTTNFWRMSSRPSPKTVCSCFLLLLTLSCQFSSK